MSLYIYNYNTQVGINASGTAQDYVGIYIIVFLNDLATYSDRSFNIYIFFLNVEFLAN
jgi:hypothetical protein